jgi:hypothetical protein
MQDADQYLDHLYGVLHDFEQDVEDGSVQGSWQEIETRRLDMWRHILEAEAARERHAGSEYGGTDQSRRRPMSAHQRRQAVSAHQRVSMLRQMAPYLQGMPDNLREELYYLLQGDDYHGTGGHGGLIGLRDRAEQEEPQPGSFDETHTQNADRWGQRDWQQLYFGRATPEQVPAHVRALRHRGYPIEYP